jgi:hypothetical protein
MSEFPTIESNLIQLGEVVSIARGTVNPGQSPLEAFNYYSIPGYDSTGGPSQVFGKEIQSNKTILESRCVLISRLNPRIPRVCLATTSNNTRTICSTEFIPLVPKSQMIDLEYLTHYLQSPSFQSRFQAAAGGSTNSHSRVTPNEILDWEVFLPPLAEQKRIAEILSGMDSFITKNQSKARLLAKVHEVISTKVFREIANDPSSDMKRIDEISTLKGGNGFPVEHQGTTDGGTPFIKVSDFNTPGNEDVIRHANNYLSGESMAALRPYVFPKDTIVFAKVGAALTSNRRRVLSMPTCIDNNLMGAIPESAEPLYLKLGLLKNVSRV